MANPNPIIVTTYKLRSGGTQPTADRDFIIQTFGAEKIKADVYPAIYDLITSEHMQGQGGDFTSASYQRTQYKDIDTGNQVFTGQEEHPFEFIEETDIPGQVQWPDYSPKY